MFGYVTVNKPEIKFKDFDMYRSFYCGLCRELRERYGIPGQISLTYDMTFVVLLLSGVYEPPTQKGTSRCAVHPLKPQPVRRNAITEYCADMNVILSYYKCMDDWQDEHKPLRYVYARLLKTGGEKHMAHYPEKIRRIKEALMELSSLEKQGETDVDRVAGCSGRIMEEVFAFRKDVWESSLRRMGFYLGKFIYILDAYDDVEKDAENGNYNPFLKKYKMEGFEEEIRRMLTMMLAESCREFERMPVIRYGDILRNILYSGVWCRFTAIGQKRREERQAGGSSSLDDMIAYVDENGNITDTPPQLRPKVEIQLEDIVIATPKKEDIAAEPLKGRVEYFNTEKGYGFIKDLASTEKYFFHISSAPEGIGEGRIVLFELMRGTRGMNAVKIAFAQ